MWCKAKLHIVCNAENVAVTHREGVETIRHRLTAKLDAEGVIPRIGDGVVNVNRAIAVVFYVNVNDFAEITERDVLFTIKI